MKPAPFTYHRAQSLDEALALLAEHGGDGKPLAGGQSLIPAMNFRLATPSVLVDLNEIGALRGITFDRTDRGGLIRIGAMTRHRDVERSDAVARHVPLVRAAMPFVAHAAIRTRGTIGGSLAHADPAAELPAVMLALNAHFTLANRERARTVAAHDFFVGLFTTALEPGELLTEVAIPAQRSDTRVAFQEISRRHGDFALAGVAVAITLNETQRCTDARIALFSVGDRPVLASSAARLLVGQQLDPEVIRAAAHAAATDDIDPPGDIHASAGYRRRLVEVLTGRALAAL